MDELCKITVKIRIAALSDFTDDCIYVHHYAQSPIAAKHATMETMIDVCGLYFVHAIVTRNSHVFA